jgi:hypothetical protein
MKVVQNQEFIYKDTGYRIGLFKEFEVIQKFERLFF